MTQPPPPNLAPARAMKRLISFRADDDRYTTNRLRRARSDAFEIGDPLPSRSDIIHRIINEAKLLRHKYRTPMNNLSLCIQLIEATPKVDAELLSAIKTVLTDCREIMDVADGRVE
jgi:hypothetical protein